jgi:hypothetical protein
MPTWLRPPIERVAGKHHDVLEIETRRTENGDSPWWERTLAVRGRPRLRRPRYGPGRRPPVRPQRTCRPRTRRHAGGAGRPPRRGRAGRPRAGRLRAGSGPAWRAACAQPGGEVGAGERLQVPVRELRRGRATRVDDDVPGPALEPLHRGRHGVGRVAAHEEHDVGVGDVGERERQPAVDAEGAVRRRGGRRHAEPAVVVDHRAAQGNAGELAELVGLLVGEPTAAEAAHRVRAVLGLRFPDRRGHAVEGVVPAHRRKRPGATVAGQRRGEPLGVVDQLRRGRALAAQPAAVDRESSRPTRSSTPSSRAVRWMPHCSEQYGQCVAVTSAIAAQHRRPGLPRRCAAVTSVRRRPHARSRAG